MKKFLDYQGLDYFMSLLANKYATKEEVDALIECKTIVEWADVGDTVYPAGKILVYTNRSILDGTPIPDIKLADGVNTVNDLPFLVDRSLDELVNKYTQIIDDDYSEDTYLVGSTEGSKILKRNKKVKISGGTVYADAFIGAASSLQNSLFIGEVEYNGSEEVKIPVYKGE